MYKQIGLKCQIFQFGTALQAFFHLFRFFGNALVLLCGNPVGFDPISHLVQSTVACRVNFLHIVPDIAHIVDVQRAGLTTDFCLEGLGEQVA